MPKKIGKIYGSGCLTGDIEFTWIIENFSTLNSDINRAYTSERYYPDGSQQENSYWYMDIYPGGGCRDSAGFVSLFLYYEHSYVNQFNVIWTFNIRNADGKILCRKQLSRLFSSDQGYGFPELIRRRALISKLKDDTVFIAVQVHYSLSSIQNIDSVKLVQGDMSLHTKLHKDLKALLRNKETSDAIITVDGINLPVHKSILTSRSKVFAAIFQRGTIENTFGRVHITDFKVDTVKSLLQFIYSASVDDINIYLALDLLKAAGKYDLCDLMEYCSNYLMAHACDENIIQILITADMCNASRLRKDAIEYFCGKKVTVDSERDFSRFIQYPNLLVDIVAHFKREKKWSLSRKIPNKQTNKNKSRRRNRSSAPVGGI